MAATERAEDLACGQSSARPVATMEAGEEETYEVQLYIYDLAKRLDRHLTEGNGPPPELWLTGLIAYGREYYFWKGGIESCNPGETALGEPDQILPLGKTELPYSVFLEYILALGESTYRPNSFDAFRHGSNSFTREVSVLLTGKPTPEEFTEFPNNLEGSALGKAITEYLQSVNLKVKGTKGLSFGNITSNSEENLSQMATDHPRVNGQLAGPEGEGEVDSQPRPAKNPPPEAQAETELPAEQRVEGDSRPQEEGTTAPSSNAQDQGAPPSPEQVGPPLPPSSETDTPQPRRTSSDSSTPTRRLSDDSSTYLSSRRPRRYSDPPIVFKEIDGIVAIHQVCDCVQDKLSPDESQALADLREYVETENGAWALGNLHLDLLGRLLTDTTLPAESSLLTLRFLQAVALKEDIILLLHQDRKDHRLMSFFYKIESLPLEHQERVGKLVCNFCQGANSFDWLMYISEWDEGGRPCSNSRVTVRVAVHCLLSEKPNLQEVGVALMFNLSLKELFDDSATELAMAILQFLHGDLSEEHAFLCLTSLLRFLSLSYTEVPALTKMLGPDLHKFDGMSARIDEILQAIFLKLETSISAQ